MASLPGPPTRTELPPVLLHTLLPAPGTPSQIVSAEPMLSLSLWTLLMFAVVYTFSTTPCAPTGAYCVTRPKSPNTTSLPPPPNRRSWAVCMWSSVSGGCVSRSRATTGCAMAQAGTVTSAVGPATVHCTQSRFCTNPTPFHGAALLYGPTTVCSSRSWVMNGSWDCGLHGLFDSPVLPFGSVMQLVCVTMLKPSSP